MHSEHPKCQIWMTSAACLWLGLFPLLNGGTYQRLTAHKHLFMLGLCGVTLVCFLVTLFLSLTRKKRFSLPRSVFVFSSGPSGERKPSRPLVPLILAAALLTQILLSCFFGGYGADTWWTGASVRKEGLISQLCYLGLFFAFAVFPVRLRPLFFAAAGGVAVYAVIVLLQRAGLNPLGLFPAGRSYALNPEFQGPIGNIDMVTGWLCMLSGFFLYGGLIAFSKKGKGRDLPVLIACAFGLAVSVFLILTMGVQFGVISLAVLALVTLFAFIPKKYRLPLLLLLLVLVFLLVWFWPGHSGGVWELHEILRGRSRLSFGSNRVAVWTYGAGLARQNLLLGGGSDTFDLRFSAYLRENHLEIPTEQDGVELPAYFDNPHNEYLAHWLNHGLPAMLLFIALLLVTVYRRRQRLLPLLGPASAAVLCYAVQAFFSFSVCIVAPMFWVLLGIGNEPE